MPTFFELTVVPRIFIGMHFCKIPCNLSPPFPLYGVEAGVASS
jgi:hypothetical protein